MKKQILISAGVAVIFSTAPVFATEMIAYKLFGASNYETACNTCHTNANINTADNGNLMSTAKAAYNKDKWGLSGLKAFVAAASAPVVPTCTNGQVLNAAKTACETPKPVTPTCTGNTVLNATKDACVALPAPIITPTPSDTTSAETPTVSTENTKPVLNKVATQWDVAVGETLRIPLSVQDTEQDEFKMLASKSGTKFSEVYTDEKTQLPTVDFLLTPTIKDVNKVLTFSFQAKETKTTQKLMSNKVSVRVRVWATNDRNEASVSGLKISTSAFKNGKLNLSGAVVFNNLLTTTERKQFITNKFDLTITDLTGVVLTTLPLTVNSSGNWSVSLPIKSVPCDIVLEYQGQKAQRSVVGCVAPTASITSTIVAQNDVLNNRFDDDNHENEHDEHHDGHDD